MTEHNRRKHPRCTQTAAVSYQFMNNPIQHEATARNYSRFGMCFETPKSLAPGTLIVIRASECGPGVNPEFAPAFCSADPDVSEACQELKMYVVAEVKRCGVVKEGTKPLFGISVRYISPAT
jgi:hypothetical protein